MTTLAPSFLIEAFLFFQETRTCIKACMSSNYRAELADLDQLEKPFTYLRTIQNILMTCWLSGERSLPFGLLVLLLNSIDSFTGCIMWYVTVL